MKRIIIGLVVLIILLGCAPLITGYYFKNYYLDLLADLNRIQPYTTITVLEYRMGWLHSYAKLSISYKSASTKPNFTTPNFTTPNFLKDIVIIEQKITHGPFAYNRLNHSCHFAMGAIQSNLHLTPFIEKILLPQGSSQGVIQGFSIIKFNGDFNNDLKTPAFNLTLPMVGHVSWEGLKSTINFQMRDHQIKRISSDIELGTFSAQHTTTMPKAMMNNTTQLPNTQMNVVNQNATSPSVKQIMFLPIKIRSDIQLNAMGLWSGNSTLLLNKVLVKDGERLILDLDTLSIFIGDSIEGNAYSLTEYLNLKSIKAPSFFLPNIGPVDFTFAINQINVLELKKLQDTLSQRAPVAKNSEEVKNVLLPLWIRLIMPTTSIQNTAFINTSFGQVIWDLKVFWAKNQKAPQSYEEVEQHTNLILNLHIASTLVDKLIEYDNSRIAAKKLPDQTNPSAMNSLFMNQLQTNQQSHALPTQSTPMTPAEGTKATLPATTSTETNIQLPGAVVNENSLKKIIDEGIENGYLIKKGDHYFISIIREQGIIKINGKIPTSQPNPTISPQMSLPQTPTINPQPPVIPKN